MSEFLIFNAIINASPTENTAKHIENQKKTDFMSTILRDADTPAKHSPTGNATFFAQGTFDRRDIPIHTQYIHTATSMIQQNSILTVLITSICWIKSKSFIALTA